MSRQPVGQVSGNGIDELGHYFPELDVDRRHAAGAMNGKPVADDLPAWLTAALGLDAVGRTVVGASVFGRGPNARVDVLLSGDDRLVFERFGDLAKPSALAANLVTQVGVVKTFKGTEAAHVAAAIFRLAKHHRESTDDDTAREWAIEYLRVAAVQEHDLGDQMERWRAFSELARLNPTREAGDDRSAHALAAASAVLADRDTGARWVRCEWFYAYVRRAAGGLYSPAALATQMEAVGWKRPNSQAKIKATSPSENRSVAWAFYVVERDWEAQVTAGYESYARAHTRTRAAHREPPVTRNPQDAVATAEQEALLERAQRRMGGAS
jgi:hypothetical protein